MDRSLYIIAFVERILSMNSVTVPVEAEKLVRLPKEGLTKLGNTNKILEDYGFVYSVEQLFVSYELLVLQKS